jgi:uncharacterized membrane protein YfhO
VKKTINHKAILYMVSFLIPLTIMVMVSILLKKYPFGEGTYLFRDLSGQYIDFFAYYQSVFTSKDNLIYAFTRVLGGNNVGLTAYYLLSPFNLIFLLFQKEHLPMAVMIIMWLKIATAGLIAAIFLAYMDTCRKEILIFSTTYALMGYSMVYLSNIMWLDGVILLPLIALGIHQIIHHQRPTLYILSLFAAIITNFYIAYILCLFSLIYFWYQLTITNSEKGSAQTRGQLIRVFIASSLLTVGLSAFLLIPTLFSMSGGKVSFDFFNFCFPFRGMALELITKLFTGSFTPRDFSSSPPNIYVGLFPILMILIYVMNPQIPYLEKKASFMVLGILGLSFLITPLDTIWHGFTTPVGFPYRNAFVASFLMMYLGYQGYTRTDIQTHQLKLPFLIIAITLGGIWFTHTRLQSPPWVVLDGIILILLLSALALLRGSKSKQVLWLVILIIHSFQMGTNAYITIQQSSSNQRTEYSQYQASNEVVSEAVAWVRAHDPGLYRMEKTFQRSNNDAMQFGYYGLSHFSSTEKINVLEFMRQLGLTRYQDFWVYYDQGSTVGLDSLMGIRYLLAKTWIGDKPYPVIHQTGNIQIRENPYGLPMVFPVGRGVMGTLAAQNNPFIRLNAIFRAMVPGVARDIYRPVISLDPVLDNLLEEDVEDDSIRYTLLDPTISGTVTYRLTASGEGIIYGSIQPYWYLDAELWVNGQSRGPYLGIYRRDAFPIAYAQAGETVTVTVRFRDEVSGIHTPHFYQEDLSVLQEYVTKIRQQPAVLDMISSSHLTGRFEIAENQMILATIPYDSGWQVTVDGKRVEPVMVWDLLLGIPVTAGVHEVTFRYVPPGLGTGALISGISAILLGVWVFIKYKKKRPHHDANGLINPSSDDSHQRQDSAP